MGFALMIKGAPKAEIDAKVGRAASILDLGRLLDRYPKQLSGGQRQRVAMGRAIVRDPAVFLFDEPLSNLDAKLRVAMRVEIKELHQRLGTTIVYVTHDQIEAMTMADKIVVMRDGRVEQIGAPLDLYDRPDNVFVAGFIGSPAMNFLKGKLATEDGRAVVRADGGVTLPLDGVRARRWPAGGLRHPSRAYLDRRGRPARPHRGARADRLRDPGLRPARRGRDRRGGQGPPRRPPRRGDPVADRLRAAPTSSTAPRARVSERGASPRHPLRSRLEENNHHRRDPRRDHGDRASATASSSRSPSSVPSPPGRPRSSSTRWRSSASPAA